METESTKSSPKFLYFLVAVFCLINLAFLTLILWSLSDFKEYIVNNNIVASVITNESEEKFAKQLREDLGLKNEVAIIIAPRYNDSLFSPLQNYQLDRLLSQHPIIADLNDPTGRILMRESLYKELSDEDKRAAIAHQMCHIYLFIKNDNIARPGTVEEIEANRCAIKYVHPQVLITLYRQYSKHSPSTQILIDELERQKLTTAPKSDAP